MLKCMQVKDLELTSSCLKENGSLGVVFYMEA